MTLNHLGGDFELIERPAPELGPGEVLVQVEAVGAGLTLEHIRQGRGGRGNLPRILGHEFGGVVADVGTATDHWQPGDRVAASFYLICGDCSWCLAGRENLCERMTGLVGVQIDGAFADYIKVPARNLVSIPDGVPLATAGIVADAIATSYHVVATRLRLRAGDRVVVVGAGGGIGVHAVQMVRAFGGVPVAVERHPAKAAELKQRGLADVVVAAASDDWSSDAKEAAGAPISAVIDTVATRATLEEGLRSLGRSGTLVALGFQPNSQFPVDPIHLLEGELTVTGTRYATRTDIANALKLVRDGHVEPIVGAAFPVRELDAAFKAIADGAVFGRVLINVTNEW